ncbi:hypothetical protein D9757_009495 [Collybiopsis confluens]|uniref:Uncharacterized protein n=1 Tax=Collybiopsis confluens TaxID=2823264 RepID=A0A8H5H5G0_9AGAR|nr:hypothetical protein D9757_009495 [Collybiopsis confluens]
MAETHMRSLQSSQPGPGPSTGTSSRRNSKSRTASHPTAAWKENYVSSYDDFKVYSFGQPPDPDTLALASAALQDKRFRIVKREGDETSSSSDDSNEKTRKRVDITPRASLISLEAAASQHDGLPRSHLSQSKVNYYDRGSVNSEHRHPMELDGSVETESRSQMSRNSISSYDPGYDASSSRRDSRRSWDSSPSDAAEEISISSTRHSGGSRDQMVSYSGSGPSSSDLISISSSRRSSLSGSHSIRYDKHSADLSHQEAQLSISTKSTNSGSDQYLAPTAATNHPDRSLSLQQSAFNTASFSSDLSTSDEFNLPYIMSGLPLNGNATSVEGVADESALDFVRSLADGRAIVGQGSSGSNRGRLFETWARATTISPFPEPSGSGSRRVEVGALAANTQSDNTLSSSIPNSQNSPARTASPPPSTSLLSLRSSSALPQPSSGTEESNFENSHLFTTPKRKKSLLLGSIGAFGTPRSPNSKSISDQISPVAPVSPSGTIGPSNAGDDFFSSQLPHRASELMSSAGTAPPSTPTAKSHFSSAAQPPSVLVVSPDILSNLPSLAGSRILGQTYSPAGHPPSGESESASLKSFHTFANDDSFQTRLMVWGGQDYGSRRREWLVRRERKGIYRSRDDQGARKRDREEAGGNYDLGEVGMELAANDNKGAKYRGMLIGTEEVWENFLLGRFIITREDVFSRNSAMGKDGSGQGKEANGAGPEVDRMSDRTKSSSVIPRPDLKAQVNSSCSARSRSQINKTCFQMRIRDDAPKAGIRPGHTPVSTLSPQSTLTPTKRSSISAIPENVEMLAPTLDHVSVSQTLASLSPTTTQETGNVAPSSLSLSSSRRSHFDSHHPAILVHRHSKVAAFSINRQYSRDRGGNHKGSNLHTSSPPSSSKPSSSQRPHIIMLAPRDVQEGRVIDRHDLVVAAFSPVTGVVCATRADGKAVIFLRRRGGQLDSSRPSEHSLEPKSLIKSDGQLQLNRNDAENTSSLGLRHISVKVLPGFEQAGRDPHDVVGTRSAPPVYHKTKKRPLDGKSKSTNGGNIRQEHKRENKDHTLDSSNSIRTTATRVSNVSSQIPGQSSSSSRPNIFKRFLPWDTPSSFSSSHSPPNISITASSDSAFHAIHTVDTEDTTPAQSINSEVSVPYVPPWMTLSTPEQQEMQRHVLGQLEHSFENVGLLPSTKDKKASGRRGTGGGGISSRLSHKKTDVLSYVPPDAYFMLLPLWPSETDPYSQHMFPFQNPGVSPEDRRYLLVFYKPLPTDSSRLSDLRKILLPGFHALARPVSYTELQATGVRVSEQGITVSGPLEEAFKHMPRSNASSGDNVSIQPIIIGTSNSRDGGIEFDPEALIELGLCSDMSDQRRPLPLEWLRNNSILSSRCQSCLRRLVKRSWKWFGLEGSH